MISIHAPHTGRDFACIRHCKAYCSYFNPRAPYGARLNLIQAAKLIISISIHAPHTGRDPDMVNKAVTKMKFQSTRPIRGATRVRAGHSNCSKVISIHAPHTGRDKFMERLEVAKCYFNPRAPYGARLCNLYFNYSVNKHFNPRAPYGARRGGLAQYGRVCRISIHAPHTGRDQQGPVQKLRL